jgi:predicted hydrocarbon binding protein
MHGIIFAELQKYCTEKLGEKNWEKILRSSHVGRRSYNSLQAYPDVELNKLLKELSHLLEEDQQTILEQFGEYLAPNLLKSSKFLINPNWTFLDLLEHTQEVIHKAVYQSLRDSAPPILKVTRTSQNEIVILYDSHRKMCGFAKGLIQGMALHSHTQIELEQTACMLLGDPYCRFVVKALNPSALDFL